MFSESAPVQAESNPRTPTAKAAPRTNIRPFSRPTGSGARFLGVRGTPDYLPHLPDGDMTLLNEKADRFAVFVRRVATQVFGQIRSTGWAVLRARDIRDISGYATIIAVLSPEGDLIKTMLRSSSGSAKFDAALKQAVQVGARDPHPPPDAAAEDGNFYFIFKAKSWVKLSGNARGRGASERRWLMLATGLE